MNRQDIADEWKRRTFEPAETEARKTIPKGKLILVALLGSAAAFFLAGCSLKFQAELLAPLNKSGRTETSTPEQPKPLPTPPPAATPTPSPEGGR